MLNVYAAKIEWDEDGCHLILATDDGRQDFRLDDPEQLYDAVMGGVWPWLYEREQALKTFRQAVDSGRLTDAGYENPRAYDRAGSAFVCDDPEGDWIETLRDSADLARKAAKENGR